MSEPPLDPQAASTELRGRLGLEHAGVAFLVYRDGAGRQQVHPLEEATTRITIGRGSATDLWLAWDDEVSRVHAELERVGDDWTVVDDGLSANGTFCNGERVSGRRRLRDGDTLKLGQTTLVFYAPSESDWQATRVRKPSS